MRIVKKSGEQGSGIVLMILLLFIFAVLVALHFNQLMQQWQKQIFYEKQYYHNYNTASSALLWGLRQAWPSPNDTWFCQKNRTGKMAACIKKSSQPGLVLVKGTSETLSLYLLVEYDPIGKLIYRHGHWLDYCPEKSESNCD